MLELRGVVKQYPYGARVLGGVNMRVDDGEIVAVLGGVGSGKTTLLKCIAAVTDHEGEVFINGKKLVSGNKAANVNTAGKDDVLMVFDDLAVFKNRSFYYNLAYPLKIRGIEKSEIDRRVKAAAERMGITACLYERVSRMPLIDVKRLGVARLFLREYQTILVDDITHGLSRDEAETLWSEVAPVFIEKAKDGKSIIFATESRDEALSIADRIAVMHSGEFKQIDSAQNILDNPSSVWAAQAIENDYHFERGRLEIRDGQLAIILEDADGKEYALDASAFKGKIARGYENKDIYVGWRSCDFAQEGERNEDVKYALRNEHGFVLHTQSGICVRTSCKAERICTLPVTERVCLYDFTNENSILSGCSKDSRQSGEAL